MYKLKVFIVSFFALLFHAGVSAESTEKQRDIAMRPDQRSEMSLNASLGLTQDQKKAYEHLQKEIDNDFEKRIQDAKGNDKQTWVKQYRSYKNNWESLLELQSKINQAVNTLESPRVESDKTYRMATVQVLRPTVASFVQTWKGMERLMKEAQINVHFPPVSNAVWVWDNNQMVKSMLLTHDREIKGS